MNFLDSFIAHLPVLLLLAPLIGLATVTVSGWSSPQAAARTWHSNIWLSVALGLLLAAMFQTGGASPSEDVSPRYRFHGQLRGAADAPSAETTAASAPIRGWSFGIDGLSLAPLLIVLLLLPVLAAGWDQRPAAIERPRRLLLAWQIGALAAILAADAWSLAAALVGSALALRLTLARDDSSSSSRGDIDRFFSWHLLGTVLIVGGLLGIRVAAVQYLVPVDPRLDPASFRDLSWQFAQLPQSRPEALLAFHQAAHVWIGLVVCGALLRCGTIPIFGGAARVVADRGGTTGILLWLDGPVVSLALVWRVLSLFPVRGYAVLEPFGIGFALIVAWCGVALLSRPSRPGLDAGLRWMQSAALLGLGLCTANPTAHFGCLLFALAVPLALGLRDDSGRGFARVAALAEAIAGFVILWGVLSGRGAGGLAMWPFCLGTLGWLCGLTTTVGRIEHDDRDLADAEPGPRLIVVSERGGVRAEEGGERPVWFGDSSESPPRREPAQNTLTVGGLLARLAVCTLFVPGIVWKTPQAELMRLPFPQTERERLLDQKDEAQTTLRHDFSRSRVRRGG